MLNSTGAVIFYIKLLEAIDKNEFNEISATIIEQEDLNEFDKKTTTSYYI